MWKSGVRTGMETTVAVLRRIPQVLLRALLVSIVAVVGPSARGAAVCRTAPSSRQTAGGAASGCALPFSSSIERNILTIMMVAFMSVGMMAYFYFW